MFAIVAASACSDGTAPVPDTDPSPAPYLRTSVGVRVNGATRVVIIPARFADGPPPPAAWTQAEIHRRYIGNNSIPGLTSVVFRTASEGKFALRGDVASWVSTSIAGNGNPQTHVIQAVQQSDPGIDFTRYDNDGPDGIANSGDDDGLVDGGVVILHSSLDLHCGQPAAGPHPHAQLNWRVGTPPVPAIQTQDVSAKGGTIGIVGYTIMSVADCSGTSSNASTLAHELGHLLFGITDLYHQSNQAPATEVWRGRRWVLGCWDLMSAGSGWGCGSGPPIRTGEQASAFGAWARVVIGWTTPQVVPTSVNATYTLDAVGRGGTALRLDVGTNEYFYVEYRQIGSGDNKIPGNGVLISHFIGAIPFRPADSTAKREYRVALVEADDDSALVRIDVEGGNRGVLADAFGRTVTTFASGTHSAAKTQAGAPLPFRLEQISFDAAIGKASVRVVPVP